jgi:hypothetical protein
MIKIHNTQTDEIIDREMNAAEFKQYEADQAALLAKQAETKTSVQAKAALLVKLGITEDEAKLLLS